MKKLIGVGDNVVDFFEDRKNLYPGGNAFNVCVYAKMLGVESAYLGYFGSDIPGNYNRRVLKELGVDFSKSRIMDGKSGIARVRVEKGERVFLGSNKGGALKEQNWEFSQEDLAYIRQFQVVHTSLNSYLEDKLELLKENSHILSFDFSNRYTDEYLSQVCPYCDIACLSLGHLPLEEAEEDLGKAVKFGVSMAVGTLGERGALILKDGRIFKGNCEQAEVKDTMGAGDAYLSAVLTYLFCLKEKELEDQLTADIPKAMAFGAKFAAKVCELDGAFGYGTAVKEDIL